ncbi:CLUMA_CG002123, isoform A [Clunio marinus]|uniref:CLUMA_CG002123, isoform A n=1 Tax=Clunio marinus TaxID=568069 RepID=A0A1J1HQ54_9DIPT|nr:CLUMA_CG002123, isoform A [Clunio marinus]
MDHNPNVINKLSSHISKDEQFPNCLYLFGHKSTGKSVCLQKFLKDSEDWLCSVVIQAAVCYKSQILYETVINKFFNHKLSRDNNYESYAKIDTVENFLKYLNALDPAKSFLIAIENAERLRDMEFNILPILTKLQEFTGLNISCVLVSHIAFSKFDLSPMIKIHVPDFSKADLIAIFSNDYESLQEEIIADIHKSLFNEIEQNQQLEIVKSLDQEFYKNYLSIFLNVFYKVTRDLSELQLLANKCYKSYYAPVLRREIKVNDVTNLWRNITKLLKTTLNSSSLRIQNLSASEFDGKQVNEDSSGERKKNLRTFAQTLELPFFAKYLLIASFLASHNDAKFDKRLFMKHHGKERKRQQKAKVSEKLNIQFGPKSFTIDRLLAIFYAILDEKVGLTCNLLAQISTLVDLNFLTFSSGENNIMEGTAKLQSTIGLDFAINIGRVVGFNVRQYLTDFH